MAKARFARCFPLPDGNVCCEHWNGNYIVFGGYRKDEEAKEEVTDSGNESTTIPEEQ